MGRSSKGVWIDVSIPLKTGMVHWPGDPSINFKHIKDLTKGDVCTVSRLSMGSHTGTHMDAPLHFVRGGVGMDRMPLDTTVGAARVIAIRDNESIKPAELKPHKIRRGERILFKTKNSGRCWKNNGTFVKNFVFISHAAAQFLAKIGVKMVGVDYLSVGGFACDGVETHQALLKKGVWIIEGLNLAGVKPGKCELICLPIKIVKGDGAPARAILRRV